MTRSIEDTDLRKYGVSPVVGVLHTTFGIADKAAVLASGMFLILWLVMK